MKFLAFQKYPYTADYYKYNIIGAGEQATYEYYYESQVRFAGMMTEGERLEIFTEIPLKIAARLDNIRSKDGALVAPIEGAEAGLSFRVASMMPRLNPFGFHEGYRHVLVRG